jgi:hypothetical protein
MTTDTTPSDLLKAKIKEFYFAVGVAMVRWQDVQFELTELFYTLVGGDHAIVSAVFNTVPSFPTKVRMVKAAALLRLANTDLLKPCNDLCKCLNDDKGVQRKRNQIAHYMMYHDPPEGENLDPKTFADKYAFYLGPQMFDAQQRRTQLKTTDIENRTKEFGEAAKRIRDFNAQVKASLAAT